MIKLHYPRIETAHKKYLGFVDGLEGGFSIFTGLVIGLSFTTDDSTILIASALIGILVNAVNTATIRYSNEHYLDELDGREKRSPVRHYLMPALTEFCLYGIVGALSVLPLLIVSSLPLALSVMVAICIAILFVAGAVRGAVLGNHWLRDGMELVVGGSIMILVGSVAGLVVAKLIG